MAADGLPVSHFQFDRRVEVPSSGFALDFLREWLVRGGSVPLNPGIRQVLQTENQTASCRVVDATGDGWPPRATLESMHEPVVHHVAGEAWELLDAAYLDLPAGRAGRVVYADHETHVDYHLTDRNIWLQLQCASATPPDDYWLSIAETFEFLPVEE